MWTQHNLSWKDKIYIFLIGVVECHQKKMRDSWLVYKIYYIVSFISDYICFQTNLQYIMQSGSNACRVLLLLFSCQKIVNDHNKFKKSIFSQKKLTGSHQEENGYYVRNLSTRVSDRHISPTTTIITLASFHLQIWKCNLFLSSSISSTMCLKVQFFLHLSIHFYIHLHGAKLSNEKF